MTNLRTWTWPLLVLVCGLGITGTRASAQTGSLSFETGFAFEVGRDIATERVRRAEFERYLKVLALSPEELAAARALYEGYVVGHKDARREQQIGLAELKEAGVVGSELYTKTEALFATFLEKAASLNKGLFEDLQAVITVAQPNRWARLERMRRRGGFEVQGIVSGASVDLCELTALLKLDTDTAVKVAPILAEYEVELDRHVAAWNRVATDRMGRGRSYEAASYTKAMVELREIGLLARGTNERYQRQIESELTSESTEDLRALVMEKGYHVVSRWALNIIDAGLSRSDLSPEQARAIRDVREAYVRSSAPLNLAWVAAVREWEATRAFDARGGDHLIVSTTLEPDPKERAAAKAREDLDREVVKKVRNLLREEQRAALDEASKAKDVTSSGDDD